MFYKSSLELQILSNDMPRDLLFQSQIPSQRPDLFLPAWAKIIFTTQIYVVRLFP